MVGIVHNWVRNLGMLIALKLVAFIVAVAGRSHNYGVYHALMSVPAGADSATWRAIMWMN